MENILTYSTKIIDSRDPEHENTPGHNVFIGKDEKRRNTQVLHVEFPYNTTNYSLFYKGTQETLNNVSFAICELLNYPLLAEPKKSKLYKIIIESFHVVHHLNKPGKNGKNGRKSKLNGINSLSTSCLDNQFCLSRMKDNDSICKHCYSATQQKQQLALQDNNIINGLILRNIVIPAKYWKKYFNKADISRFFRIESFGDVANKTQCLNYIEFCKAFPRVNFAAWTKNPGLWYFAFEESGKPENLSFIVSSNIVNKPELWRLTNKYVNHIFTVYSPDFITENCITINCGGRACLKDCIHKGKGCYYTNTEKDIREKLK